MNKKLEATILKGENIYVSKAPEDSLHVVMKLEKGYLDLILTTVKVPKVGKTNYVIVKDSSKVNHSMVKQLSEYILDLYETDRGKNYQVVQDDDMEDVERKALSSHIQPLLDKGIVPMVASNLKEASDELGFELDYEPKDPETSDLPEVKTTGFNVKDSDISEKEKKLIEYNDLNTKNIDYSDDPTLTSTYELVHSGLVKVVMFTGEAGTGKTSVFSRMAADAGAVPAVINSSTNADEDYFFGALRDNPDYEKDSKEALYKFQYGVVTNAIKKGHWLLIDEVNMIQNQGVIALLNDVLEYPHKLDINGETIYAHSNFRLFFAMNVGYNHTYELNQALANRVQRFVHFPEVTVNETIKRIKSNLGYDNPKLVTKLFETYESLKSMAQKYNVSAVISYRNIQACIQQSLVTGNITDAFRSTMFLSQFYEIMDDSTKDTIYDVLKQDVNELEKIFSGKATGQPTHFFDILAHESSSDSDDEDELLKILDDMED